MSADCSTPQRSLSERQRSAREPRTYFGAPGSIVAANLFRLPLPMQAEGVRLLFEMGETKEQVGARLGLSVRQVHVLCSVETKFSRAGEAIALADDAW